MEENSSHLLRKKIVCIFLELSKYRLSAGMGCLVNSFPVAPCSVSQWCDCVEWKNTADYY